MAVGAHCRKIKYGFVLDGIEQESLLDRAVSGQSDSTLELSYAGANQRRRLPTRSATKPYGSSEQWPGVVR